MCCYTINIKKCYKKSYFFVLFHYCPVKFIQHKIYTYISICFALIMVYVLILRGIRCLLTRHKMSSYAV
jgi:hypothetical protein